MANKAEKDLEERIIIYTRFPRDATLLDEVLSRAGMQCYIGTNDINVIEELNRGVGIILIASEAFSNSVAANIDEFLDNQPNWSDLPILVLTNAGRDSNWIDNALAQLRNPTFLDRPIRATTIISAARSALRARQRQYELRAADQRKDEFLAMLGHELRNPLAPIGAAAQLLEIAYSDVEKVKRSSKIIGRQVKHMTSLIDELLDVARVTRGLVTLEKVPLEISSVLGLAIEQASPKIREKNHQLFLSISPDSTWILGDQKRLIQIFVNILTNCAKYTDESGIIEITLSTSEKDIVVEFSDNGIGMTAVVIEQVFELFAQAERSSARSQGGLGIGLALVKSLLGSHGGTISAKSEGIGKGSKFRVVLPRLLQQTNENSDNSVTLPASRKNGEDVKILVVDDNEDAAFMLALFLGTLGYDLVIANLAAEAFNKALEFSPDVFLVDIGLPDMDGRELTKKLRSVGRFDKSLFIAITGYGQQKDIQDSLQSGFDHHLVKPIDMEKLKTLISQFKL